MSKFLLPSLLCITFACSNDKNANEKPYDKIWESQCKLKQNNASTFHEDKEKSKNDKVEEQQTEQNNTDPTLNQKTSKTQEQNTKNNHTQKQSNKKTSTNKEDEVHKNNKSEIPVNQQKEKTEETSHKQNPHKSVNKSASSKKTEDIKKEPNIDFSKFSFYVSDFKLNSSKQAKYSGNFKINVDVNGQKVPKDFWKNVICEIKMIKGEKSNIDFYTYKGNPINIQNESLATLKQTFHTDKTISINFKLEEVVTAVNMKIFFYQKEKPDFKIYLKKNKDSEDDILEFKKI